MTANLPRISVLPLAKLTKGSYTYILYDLLQREFEINVIGLPSKLTISELLAAIGTKSIFHIHWIEHKYTLGMVNRLGRFSKFFVLFTLPLFLLCLFMLRSVGCTIVTTLHNMVPHRVLFPRLERCAFKITLHMSKIVYVHTTHAKLKAISLYGLSDRKIKKIYHGNWMHVNSNVYTTMKARQLLSIDADAFVMCFIGRLSPDKGLHLLLECLLNVKLNVPLYLIVAGSPSDKEYFDRLIRKYGSLSLPVTIMWYPYRISNSCLNLLVNACDVGVLPYVKTSTPSTILLFMSFGKPVIAPSFPEVKEFVGCSNWLLYDNLIDLSAIIEKAADSKTALSKVGEDLLKRVKMFDWKQTAQKTYESFLELQT